MWLVAWVFGWATRHIEQIMADVDGVWGRCGSCGWGEFELCVLDEPDLPGTVQIDGAGNVVGVTGLLYCAACGEIWDADEAAIAAHAGKTGGQPSQGTRPVLRLVQGDA